MAILETRAAVFGYRLRFSPETQAIRQTVVDHLVLRNLRSSDKQVGESTGRLNSVFLDGVRVATLTINEIKASLRRLEKEGLIKGQEHRRKKRWTITTEGDKKLESDEEHALRIIDQTLEQLFGTDTKIPNLQECFIRCLSSVFDRLAQSYLETVVGTLRDTAALSEKTLEPILQRVLDAFPGIPSGKFKTAIGRFFRESTPDFDWLKWTFCKNYYLVRAIGLGEGSDILSKKVFEGATFYLDTNVMIKALDTSSPHHNPIKHVLESLRRIGCKLNVLEITLNELELVASRQGDKLEKVLAQIPDALLPKVRGIVARAEAAHRRDPSAPTPKEVLSNLENPQSFILSKLDAEIKSDFWFDEQSQDQETKNLAKHLQEHYYTITLGRKKTDDAAIHDALALKWIDSKRDNQQNCYFLTLDASLPTVSNKGSFLKQTESHALSVYAVLPWLGSVVMADEEIPQTYSSLLSAQMLTLGTRFSLQEFRLLAELEMDCGQLPAEDVEQCLLFLRREARNIDVSKAEDREKLHHIVRGFFASPDRKYVAELSSLHGELAQKDVELERIHISYETEKQQSREKIEEYRRRELKARIKLRLSLTGLGYLVTVVICVLVSLKYGEGENFLQKVGGFWWLFGLLTASALALGRWLCRGELWNEAKELFRVFGKE